MEFVTEPIPPAVLTEAAAEVTRTSVAVYGAVNPKNGPITSCEFELGPTTAYGRTVECGFVAGLTAFPAATNAAVPVFARVYGLHPSTAYHFRVVAIGEGGRGEGADQAFTTLEAEEPAPKPPGPGAQGVLSWSELKPAGKRAKISALLKAHGFNDKFTAPGAGTVVLRWYYLPPGTKLGGKRKHAPVLVAAGKLTFHAAGPGTVHLGLTSAGSRLLRGKTRVRLTATGLFTPVKGLAQSTAVAFQISR